MKIPDEILLYGQDILSSPGMKEARALPHHRRTCRYRHSVNVARVSLALSRRLGLAVRPREMVRGALLHDYYRYDRRKEKRRRHLRSHAAMALENAAADFSLSPVEADIIRHHMFPINLHPPRCREGILVCLADKIATVGELLGLSTFVK